MVNWVWQVCAVKNWQQIYLVNCVLYCMITIAYEHNIILETLLQPKIDLLKRSLCTN
jgi:hypothetical protein